MKEKVMRISINTIVDSCPKKGVASFKECSRCPFFQSIEGLWPEVKVKCGFWGNSRKLKVSLLVPCSLKGKTIDFKTCLKCPLHRGFYGFHDNNPVVYCLLRGPFETPEDKIRLIARIPFF